MKLMLGNQIEHDLNDALMSVVKKTLTEHEVELLFSAPSIRWLYGVWCKTEGYNECLRSLQLFAIMLSWDAVDNISSYIPADENDREELKKNGMSFEDAFSIYKDTDMPFFTLYEALEWHIKEEGGGVLVGYDDTYLFSMRLTHSEEKIKKGILKVLKSESGSIFAYFMRLERIIANPFALDREVEGFPYDRWNPDFKIQYKVNNLTEKYIQSKSHFRYAMTSPKNGPMVSLGYELVWDDTGKEVEMYKGKWLDNDKVEAFKHLGRYTGKEDKEPIGPFGGPIFSIVNGNGSNMSFMK